MPALPSDIPYGYVVGRYLLAVGDTVADEDVLPDAAAAAGTIRVVPTRPIVISRVGAAATVVTQPVILRIDGNGYVVDPAGQIGAWLVTGRYTATFSLTGVSLAPFEFTVNPAHTAEAPLDLSLVTPTSPSASEKFVVNEQVYTDTLAARDATYVARDEVVGLADTFVTFKNFDGTPVVGSRVVITLTADQTDIQDITVEAI